jgi:hypothetical protein
MSSCPELSPAFELGAHVDRFIPYMVRVVVYRKQLKQPQLSKHKLARMTLTATTCAVDSMT